MGEVHLGVGRAVLTEGVGTVGEEGGQVDVVDLVFGFDDDDLAWLCVLHC
jgi:hypothetical protein